MVDLFDYATSANCFSFVGFGRVIIDLVSMFVFRDHMFTFIPILPDFYHVC